MNISAISQLPEPLQARWQLLLSILSDMESAVVAYSGGVDSSLLAVAAHQALGGRMLAVMAASPSNPQGDVQAAAALAAEAGFPFEIVEHDDLQNPGFVANPPDRCYHCKLDFLGRINQLALERSFRFVLEGSNADDVGDYRPGRKAAAELDVRSPLEEARLSKPEIRALARAIGLSVWDRPSSPCLASRFPYGTRITRQGLTQVDQAEAYLKQQGFSPVRVRHESATARIEVAPEQIARLVALREPVRQALLEIGYQYVAVDLQGYRQGSLNEVLGK